jgi:hypothetical protein
MIAPQLRAPVTVLSNECGIQMSRGKQVPDAGMGAK